MSLTSTTTRVQYAGNSSATAFPITFAFWSAADLLVILTTTATGVQTTWSLGAQFTVTGGSGSTGTLTVSTSPTDYTPATGTTLSIISNLPNTQPTALPVGGPIPSASLEQQMDQIVRQVQQLAKLVVRSLVQPDGDTADIGKLPAKVLRASMLLGFDANSDPISVAGSSSGTLINAAMVDVVQAVSHATGRSTFGFGTSLTGALTTEPTRTVKASGSGTYTTPTGATRIIVRMVGGGGGGGGSGTTTTGGAGGTGGNTTFGTTFLTSNGGVGAASASSPTGGAGGTATGGDINITGATGGPASGTSAISCAGGTGAASPFGGGGAGGIPGPGAGAAGATNSGSGGGGGGGGSSTNPPGGGGVGGYLEKLIVTPLASYGFAIGAAGAAGAAGTSGAAGGAGGSGLIIIDEFYN